MRKPSQLIFKHGDPVTYLVDTEREELGMVKAQNEFDHASVFVVFNCGGDWDNYLNYPAVNTEIKDLVHGW